MNPTHSPRRKAPATRLLPVALAAMLAAGGALAQTPPATNALPVLQGGSTPRNATIGAQTGTGAAPVMNINQNAARGVIEWQSFDIGSAARVNIVQPNAQSVLVNRVMGGASAPASQIYGAMSANGRVFLVNPAGVTFGAGAQVNVGSLVASTLDLTPAMTASNYEAIAGPDAGNTIQFAGGGLAGITVDTGATITADPAGGGSVVLVDHSRVTHNGVIDALRGHVALSTGSAANVVLPVTSSGFVDLVVTQASTVTNFVSTSSDSVIAAEGGSVVLGHRASRSTADSDNITLEGVINVGSTTGAAGSVTADAGGDVGSVYLRDGAVIAAMGTGAGQTGGAVTLRGSRITVEERDIRTFAVPPLTNATIDVSGSAGGGVITLGGDTARSVFVGAANVLSADATASGNGGRLLLAANYANPNATAPAARVDFGVTEVYGTLTARGGLQGGNGGQVETSGRAITTRLDYLGDI